MVSPSSQGNKVALPQSIELLGTTPFDDEEVCQNHGSTIFSKRM
jgi:hypothetical protein